MNKYKCLLNSILAIVIITLAACMPLFGISPYAYEGVHDYEYEAITRNTSEGCFLFSELNVAENERYVLYMEQFFCDETRYAIVAEDGSVIQFVTMDDPNAVVVHSWIVLRRYDSYQLVEVIDEDEYHVIGELERIADE